MGVHSLIKNKKRHCQQRSKSRGAGKRKQLAAVKATEGKSVLIEGVELLSKDQLKKVAKNPLNNIRPSGKRRRKVLKRLKHSEREKNAMEAEPTPSSSTSKPAKKKKKDKKEKTESDEEMEVSDEEMT